MDISYSHISKRDGIIASKNYNRNDVICSVKHEYFKYINKNIKSNIKIINTNVIAKNIIYVDEEIFLEYNNL